jgi:hypothetical protein
MNENKTRLIQVNPDLFNFQGVKNKNTKKNYIPKEIKIRTHAKEKNTKTLKRSVLNFIRSHQEKNVNNILNKDNEHSLDKNSNNDAFQTDFKESLDYLEKISKENELKVKTNSHNNTLKKYTDNGIQSILFHPSIHQSNLENVNITLPSELQNNNNNNNKPIQKKYQYHNPIQPKYGCLKGGNLPTWKNYTQKNREAIHNHNNTNINTFVGGSQNLIQPLQIQPSINKQNLTNIPSSEPLHQPQLHQPQLHQPQLHQPIVFNKPTLNNNDQIKMNEFIHMKEKMNKIQNSKKPKYINKQKKTLTRTYKVGKSKIQPKISVLVSNKTIRKNINNKAQLLKQTPIQEIKKYLIKKGFIRIGSIAPNDVLRKMYETATLMCGEIQNHNPDNILFNYLNSDKDH